MPLSPMDGPAKVDLHEVEFGMLDGRKVVPCFVDRDAIDDIEHATTQTNAERLAIFERHRRRFETIASELFDAGLPPRVTGRRLRG